MDRNMTIVIFTVAKFGNKRNRIIYLPAVKKKKALRKMYEYKIMK